MPSVARQTRQLPDAAPCFSSAAPTLPSDDTSGSWRRGQPPDQTTMMVAYSDASLKNGHVGIGFKLYQPPTSAARGDPVTQLSHDLLEEGDLGREYTSEMAEYAAVIEAVQAARHHDVDMLVVASDCRNVVEKIRRREAITEDGSFRNRLYSLLEEFDNWRVKHVNRQRNTDAHEEARKAIRRVPTA